MNESELKIESTPQTETKLFHLKITYNGDDYLYSVETFRCFGIVESFSVSQIYRDWRDCGKRLKNSEKKAIKKIITNYFIK
jgi:hypothetical protein